MKSISSDFANKTVNVFFAFEAELDTATIRLWNGYGDALINGQTYIGAGNLLSFSEVQESGVIGARGITVTLGGMDDSIIAIAMGERYKNRRARIYFGIYSGSTFEADPLFTGRIDTMSIQESSSTATVSVTLENHLISVQRARETRYTAEDQKRKYPSDTFFDFVTVKKEQKWGR